MGSKYSYNILDGKQRLESIILYIGSSRDDFKILKWQEYFLTASVQREQASFEIEPKKPETSFQNLDEAIVRDFREYSIPTIEIALDEKSDSSLSEIISLFIDINQQGVPVSRFNIVKALCIDSALLKKVFTLIAIKQKRGKDLFYKMIDNDITKTLKKLRDVQAVSDSNFKVDKMWEHLLEICLFCETGQHRKPIDVIKGFINKKTFVGITLSKTTIQSVKNAFGLLNSVNRKITVSSPLFTDYTYFYSVVTALTQKGIITLQNRKDVEVKLFHFANALADARRNQTASIKGFIEKSKLHTTDVSGRQDREKMIIELLTGPLSNIAKSS